MAVKGTGIVKQLPKKTQPVVNLFIFVVACGGIYMGYRGLKRAKEKGKLRDLLNLYNEVSTTGGAGSQEAIQINFALKAAIINDAFYNNDLFGWTEDEGRAIETLLSVPKEYLPVLSKTYLEMFGKILQADFVKFLRPDQFEQVKSYFTV